MKTNEFYPLVSIIITTCDRYDLLEKAVVSVQKQDYPNIEIIIVNDSNNQKNQAEKLQDKYESNNIKVINNIKNLGGAISLNIGLKNSTGDFIAILDDDDEWTNKEKLKLQVSFLSDNPDYSIVGTNATIVNHEDLSLIGYSIGTNSDQHIRDYFLVNNPFVHSSIMFRKVFYNKYGGYDSTLPRGKDYELILRYAKYGKVSILPIQSVQYRLLRSTFEKMIKKKRVDEYYTAIVIFRYIRCYKRGIRGISSRLFRYSLFLIIETAIELKNLFFKCFLFRFKHDSQ